jgi:hypothetical protein
LKQTRGDKKIPKTVLKTRLKTKETTYTLVFGNTLLSLSVARAADLDQNIGRRAKKIC